jgi:exoribonuclease-2
VDCYAWSSSPLRRYVDLVNQWQLIAWLQGTEPAFPPSRPT